MNQLLERAAESRAKFAIKSFTIAVSAGIAINVITNVANVTSIQLIN